MSKQLKNPQFLFSQLSNKEKRSIETIEIEKWKKKKNNLLTLLNS